MKNDQTKFQMENNQTKFQMENNQKIQDGRRPK